MTDREAAQRLDSPKGLMLHGEVGTGKSMLVDLFADSLPTRRKRRWHFSTFMLETIARLEQLRQLRSIESVSSSDAPDDHPLLWLARDMIRTSPVLFLDEFQLPDRASSKIMANLMTGFFQLGGVLIATSNRMPEELAKAAGVEFAPPPSRIQSLSRSLGLGAASGRNQGMFAGIGEFADFLELLKARCDVWEMEGTKDYRRMESNDRKHTPQDSSESTQETFNSIGNPAQIDPTAEEGEREDAVQREGSCPRMFFVRPPSADTEALKIFADDFDAARREIFGDMTEISFNPWTPTTLRVYGRAVTVPRACNGVSLWTFDELCGARLGSADYITLASTFHTFIVSDVPVLTTMQKNEARRFITLLDALYEARCKLVISADADPDDLFFPEQQKPSSTINNGPELQDQDAVYPETLAEVYQDATAPFRPNISAYDDGPDYTHARLQGILSPDALEDDPPNRVHRDVSSESSSSRAEGASEHFEMRQRVPDFGQTSAFTGEDERFAYKRAASRLWEMCSAKYWARNEEGWWRPVPLEVRRWERPAADVAGSLVTESPLETNSAAPSEPLSAGEGIGESRAVNDANDKLLYEHNVNPLSISPFRSHSEPPPNISWTHVWGTMKWGKKAGAWGQGIDGLKDRRKDGEHEKSQK